METLWREIALEERPPSELKSMSESWIGGRDSDLMAGGGGGVGGGAVGWVGRVSLAGGSQ
jgi:hypothetical protein